MILFAAALILSAAIIGAAFLRAPLVREVAAAGPVPTGPAAPAAPAPAPAPTFDQHTRTACALVDPDPADNEELIGRVIARAVDQLASAIAAARAGLDPDVVDRHRDRAFLGLYRSLTGAELTRALLDALTEPAEERAAVLVNQFRSLPAYHREESR